MSESWRAPARLQCCGRALSALHPERSGGKQPAASGGSPLPPCSCSLNFAGASRPGPHSSWGQEWGESKAGEQEINRLSLGLSLASAFQLVTPLSPAPSYIHRSPQRCNRAGGRRYRNALRVPGQRSHLILAGDSVVVP